MGVYIREAGGTAIVTASVREFTVASSGSVSMTATTTMSLEATTTMTLSAGSGIDFSDSYVHGFSTGTATVSGSTATVNKQAGYITAVTTNLAAGASESLTFSNS